VSAVAQEGATQGAGEGANSGETEELPRPFDELMHRLNPARLQQRTDDWLGFDTSEQSDRPAAPEIPLAVFLETIRPLGGLKYENQLNYFNGSFSGRAPGRQSMSYEYLFADWNAARFELNYTDERLESIAAGYQRTLGVFGADDNIVHGFTLVPEYNYVEHFAGGLAFYTLGWKPEKESPWSITTTVGADRAAATPAGALEASRQ
jgi:hypothetical protein